MTEDKDLRGKYKLVNGLYGRGTFSLQSCDNPKYYLLDGPNEVNQYEFQNIDAYKMEASWFL